MKRQMAIVCALALLVFSWPMASSAVQKTKSKKGSADEAAKKVDVFKAIDDKQIEVRVAIQGPAGAVLTLSNNTENPLNVEVPLALGAVPSTPPGGNLFGAQSGPPFLMAVNPNWATGVDKKPGNRKSNVKTNKKAKDADADAKDEKKDEKKDDEDAKKDEAKKGDAVVAVVPLPPSGFQQLTASTLGIERVRLRANIGFYRIAELDKVSQATELKKLLELYGQGTIPADTAQILAWYYHSRLKWEEMTGVFPAQLEIAKKYADIVEGKAAPETAPETDKKKRKR